MTRASELVSQRKKDAEGGDTCSGMPRLCSQWNLPHTCTTNGLRPAPLPPPPPGAVAAAPARFSSFKLLLPAPASEPPGGKARPWKI
eukprot:776142-Rhodomonas_salina.4